MGKDCCCTHHAPKGADGFVEEVAGLVVRSRLTLAFGERVRTIDLRSLAMMRIDGGRYVCLADAWAAAQLPGDLTDLEFDFVGDDGFHSSAKRPRVAGPMLARGYVHASRRDLLWDAGLAMPCVYRVKRVAMIVASDTRVAADAPIAYP